MQALIGCAIQDKPGSWFVQLRVPADDLFDQVVLSNAWGVDRDDAIEKAMKFAGVDEVIEWDHGPRATPKGVFYPAPVGGDLLGAMKRCSDAISLLCFEINKHHDEI